VPRLVEVALLFFRLSLTAFGGPAAHIALIENECVRRRRWLTREQFLDLLGAANLIPGPTSTELAMHVGLRQAGWAGLIVAGLCFIGPASLVVSLVAIAYVHAGQLPGFDGLLRAVKPVVVVIVLQALVGLGRTALSSVRLAAIGALVATATVAGVGAVSVLVGAGALNALIGRRGSLTFAALAPVSAIRNAAGGALLASVSLASLFAYFLKAGSVVFGSGYVLLALLRADLVEHLHWLTEAQLLDAIAVGQITPGPVFTTATFIGYVLGGKAGAVAATIGMFLPAFIFTALSAGVLQRVRHSPTAKTFLDGVNAAAVALIAVVTVDLAKAAIVDAPTSLLAILAAMLIGWARWNPSWVLAAAAGVGYLIGR
jgi:chromate transporter